MDVRRLLVSPRVVSVEGTAERADDDRPVRVLMTKDGGLVGFDRLDTTVTHLRRSPLPAEYRERRTTLDTVYPAVRWRLSDDRLTLVEQHVMGSPSSAWGGADRIELLRRLLREGAARAEKTPDRRPMLDASSRSELPSSPRWHDLRVADAALGPVPWLMSHGDLTPENVIGRGPDAWAPIDFEDARPTPFFYDPLSLAVRDRTLRATLVSGDVDEEWTGLVRAAGLDPQVLTPQIALDAVALIAAVHHHREHRGDLGYTLRSLTQ
ncbi:phosphotransferase [Microbacterium sp. CR_7]|uniref:phosphotransferase n=1 Tax=Microbacterium sp. CR_7 TaxID=3055792 RepID=UPI0035C1BD03